MVVSDFSSDLDLFCHVIQSQAALACASCARSLGSGNRCPGVLWSGVLFLLLPSFSSLSSMARKLINFQSCTILLVAFLGKCQVFGFKISFKKAIGSSSYSITISSRVLLLIMSTPPGGWIYYFCFFRRPMSGVRCPASRMVSAHLKENY